MFDENTKKKLAEQLTARLAKLQQPLKCPLCGNSQFSLADAYIRNDLQGDLRNISIGGPSIPAIAIICNNCGFISQHALGALDLLPKEKEEEVKK